MDVLAVHHHGDVPVHSAVVIIAVLSDDPYHLYQLLRVLWKLTASPVQELVLIHLQDVFLLLQDSRRIHISADNDVTDIHAEEKDSAYLCGLYFQTPSHVCWEAFCLFYLNFHVSKRFLFISPILTAIILKQYKINMV